MNPKVTTQTITSSYGYSNDWTKVGLKANEVDNLNTIGYTGKLNGIPTCLADYLESISTKEIYYTIVTLSINTMDGTEKFLLIKINIKNLVV